REELGVARTAFALDVAARDLPGGVRLLAVFDEQGEKVEGALRLADRHGGEHHRLAEGDDRGSGGLFGHAAGLDRELPPRERLLNALHHCLGAWNWLWNDTL